MDRASTVALMAASILPAFTTYTSENARARAIFEANALWDEVMDQEMEKWKAANPDWAGLFQRAGLTEKGKLK